MVNEGFRLNETKQGGTAKLSSRPWPGAGFFYF